MNSVRKLLQSPLAGALFASSLVFFIITGLRVAGSLEFLELAAYDWLIRLQPEISRRKKNDKQKGPKKPFHFMKPPQNTPPFMAEMNAVWG